MTDRIRLSVKARQRLMTLAAQADLEPSFLLELLINKYGLSAIEFLSDTKQPNQDKKDPLVTLTNTNYPKGDNKDNLVPLTDTNELSPLDRIKAFDFD